jgi:uncharacterized Zn finger protein (UPF0148 family)
LREFREIRTAVMSLNALVEMCCPHCSKRFIENARLVRSGGSAYCPECEALFPLDENDEAIRQVLAAAKLARRRRKDRLNDLKSRWSDLPPAKAPAEEPAPPRTLSDVLRALDALLVRLDAEKDDKAA